MMQRILLRAVRQSVLLTLGAFILVGCQTTDFEQLTSDLMNAITPSQTADVSPQNDGAKETNTEKSTATAVSAQPSQTPPASSSPPQDTKPSRLKWGLISLLIGGGGPSGDDWYLMVYPTQNTRNFVGVRGMKITLSQIHNVQVWPGDYVITVFHNSTSKFEQTVSISAGEMFRMTGEYGYFFNTVKTERLPIYDENVLEFANRTSRLTENFLPVIVEQQGNWQFQFHGPQINGEVAGHGPVTVLHDGKEAATIADAVISPTEITGTVKISDEGVYEGRLNRQKFEQAPRTKVKWPSGKTFEGTFDVVLPKSGKLTQPSGSVWEGDVEKSLPTGKGRYTNTDGSWVEYDNYETRDSYIGMRNCGTNPDIEETCAFYKGEKLASEADLNDRLAEIQRQEEAEQQRLAEQQRAQQVAAAQAAEQAAIAAEAQRKAAAELAAKQPVIPQKTDDCTTATGTFSADGDLTRYTMNGSGSGSGHFRQFTYGGAAQYQFDIDFRFSTTANSISFQYDEGIYRDASSGTVLQRMSIPGGSANCSFDGRTLTIDGKQFVRG